MKIRIAILILVVLVLFYAGRPAIQTDGAAESGVPFYGKFRELPLSSIQPKGWLRQWLLKQRDGLTGHLDEIGYPFNTGAWSKAKCDTIRPFAELWWPYEQNGYWADEMTRCGYLLRDSFLIRKALKRILFVLDHPARDGYLGPEFMRSSKQGDRWTNIICWWMG